MFGTRVKTFQKKLEEHKATLISPIPSPDINAPSPTSDSDIELPEENQSAIVNQPKGKSNYITRFLTNDQKTTGSSGSHYCPVFK